MENPYKLELEINVKNELESSTSTKLLEISFNIPNNISSTRSDLDSKEKTQEFVFDKEENIGIWTIHNLILAYCTIDPQPFIPYNRVLKLYII